MILAMAGAAAGTGIEDFFSFCAVLAFLELCFFVLCFFVCFGLALALGVCVFTTRSTLLIIHY